jgi:tetratricopeptide (TPR) repeat protein
VNATRPGLELQRDRALDDLIALRAQEGNGEIDPATAAVLRTRYESEAAAALRQLEALPAQPEVGRSPRRMLLALGGFALAAGLVVWALVNAVEPRGEGGFVTGGPGTPTTIDLATISNEEMEAVVAANPDVIGMRLALAQRYVEAGEFSLALPHYFEVLERDPGNAEALMYMGWMTYLSGDAETGVGLLEQSLESEPGDVLAMWLLANARYYGLDDREGAIPLLQAVLDSGLAPPDIVAQAEEMLAEAEQ